VTDPTPLLVPMPVQALVVNEKVQNTTFLRWTNVYVNLNEFLDPVPEPFGNVSGPPDQGIHLHWKLPAAYTRGHGSAGSNVEFEFTPNRWIVVRRATTAGSTAAPQLTAWIIQSDYLGDDYGLSPFAHPTQSTSGKVVTTKIGRTQPIEKWTGDPGGKLFLRATGLADVTFTAYQPGLLGVYSFRDDTTQLADNTLLTYLVAGWYSDPKEDVLSKMTPQSLNWQVLGSPAAAPSISIPHGLISGVVWQKNVVPDRSDPDAKSMKVGVGYTSVDALAAILASSPGEGPGSEIETKLQAFQHDMLHTLDAPDGMAQLEMKIRDAWFGGTPGGTLWDIVPVSQGQTTEDPINRAAVPPPPPLNDAQAKWLADLNVKQRNADTARRELITMQWELFALWWKSQRGPHVPDTAQRNYGVDVKNIVIKINSILDPANTGGALAAVIAKQKEVDALAALVPDPASTDSIKKWSKQIPAGQAVVMLKPNALPSFSHPADPVVVIAGITPPTNEVSDSDALPCRTVDAAATGAKVGGQPVTRSSGSLRDVIALPETKALPTGVAAAVNALAVEAFFADANNAASIAVNGAGVSDPNTISALQAAIANWTAQIATISDPLRAHFAYAAWKQAWSPLYLQWKLTWFPGVNATRTGPAAPTDPNLQWKHGQGGVKDNWPFDPSLWSFDGSDDVMKRGAEYYRWTGGDLWGPNQISPRTYIGRTFLTPHATLNLIRRLSDYVKLHPEDASLKHIKDLIETLWQTRFLSQSLSGFNPGFVMRALQQSPPPLQGTQVAVAIAAENRGVPLVDVGDQRLFMNSGTPFFFPVRGGFFQFESLIIVDAFGQVLDLLQANGNTFGDATTFAPYRGAGLVPDPAAGIKEPARRMRQAPRIVQPNRFDLRLLDAADDGKEIFYTPGTNPVCGWLLPNHLNRSIAAYDAGGNPLGELLVLADKSGAQSVRWLPAPGVANPITDPANIPNKHLAGALSPFISGAIPNAPDAFRALYASIDETLWMIDPPGGQGDHDLAVLIGRPLALVRAQIQFELFGRPVTNQSWRDTFENVNADVTTFRFPIRLGSTELLDDGLIGYFTGDTYTKFNAVHPSTTRTSPYVAPIAPGNYLSMPFDYPKYSTQNLSLLLDPRANVHATTGILPTTMAELPARFYTAALAQMAVTFRAGPVMSEPATMRLPFPAEQQGTWSWIRRKGTGDTSADYEADAIIAANAQARLGDAPANLIEGWLKFVPKIPKGEG
jgi:hypothetical protein